MRRPLAAFGLAAALIAGSLGGLVLGGSVLLVGGTRAASASEKTFLIPASDGYGVAECLVGGAECGAVVAGAWCESQGFATAVSFGVAAQEDYTGAIDAVSIGTTRAAERPIRITCRD